MMNENASQAPKERADTSTPERTRGGVSFNPRVDIYETDRELILIADLPGVRPEDVDLCYKNGELVLYGKVRPRPRNRTYLVNEYEEGDFQRTFALHESVDHNRIEAECKNGVLTVHMPKVEAVRPKRINIRGE